jgi:hypothetical protein
VATAAEVDPPHAAHAGAEAAVRDAKEAGRLIVQARLLLEHLDRGRVAPGGHGPSGSGGTQRDGPGPELSESSPLGLLGIPGPSDRQSAGAPPSRAGRAEAVGPGWAAVTQALELIRTEGQWLVDAADRLVARWAAEGDPGRSSHFSSFLIDHPDWSEPQDPPQSCLSDCLP